jgi:hypothetical protein
MATTDDPGLRMTVHDLAIRKDVVIAILLQDSIADQLLEVGPRLFVNVGIVRILLRREVNVRSNDVQKTQVVPFSQSRGFIAIHNIIGNRSDLGGQFFDRTQRLKRLNPRHVSHFQFIKSL